MKSQKMTRNTVRYVTQCGKLPLLKVTAKFQFHCQTGLQMSKNAKLPNDIISLPKDCENAKFELFGSENADW